MCTQIKEIKKHHKLFRNNLSTSKRTLWWESASGLWHQLTHGEGRKAQKRSAGLILADRSHPGPRGLEFLRNSAQKACKAVTFGKRLEHRPEVSWGFPPAQ